MHVMADKHGDESDTNEDELLLDYDQDDDTLTGAIIQEDNQPKDDDSLKAPKDAVDRPLLAIKRYTNNDGNFITGVDVTSSEAAQRRLKRAERFGISEVSVTRTRLDQRAERFGNQLANGERVAYINKLPAVPDGGDPRDTAVLIHGTNKMSTKDVFKYFSEYVPSHLEWINDESCVAVWMDSSSAQRAFHGKGVCPAIAEGSGGLATEETPVWRLGKGYEKAQQILLRMATTADVKEIGAAQKSQYYKRHRNPRKRKQNQRSDGLSSDNVEMMEYTNETSEGDVCEEDLPVKRVKNTWREVPMEVDDADTDINTESFSLDVADLRGKISSKKNIKSRLG